MKATTYRWCLGVTLRCCPWMRAVDQCRHWWTRLLWDESSWWECLPVYSAAAGEHLPCHSDDCCLTTPPTAAQQTVLIDDSSVQLSDGILFHASLKRSFQPTQRTQRKERNEMTSLLDRPITAASDDVVCHWHAAKLWQTRAKLLKLNLICIISCTTRKNVLNFGLLIFFFNF